MSAAPPNSSLDESIRLPIDTKISPFQWRVIILCFLIALFDGFDTQALAFTGPAIIEAFGLEAKALAPVLTAGIIGMTVGAMLLGMLGDKLGRHKTLMLCMALFASSTLLTAFATHLNHIFILRVIAGLGMGGATPVLLSLASEYAPKRHKGLVTTGILLALPAGAMLGGLLAAKILPVWGWQSIYILGGVLPLLLLVAVYFALPESLEYLSQRHTARNQQQIKRILGKITGKPVQISASSFAQTDDQQPIATAKLSTLFQPGLARTTVGVWGTYFFNWIAWFMLLSWLPTILKQAGLSPADAPYASVTVNAAFIVFAIPLAYYLPKLNISKILYFMFACGIAIAIALGLVIHNQQWGVVFALIALAGFGIGGQQLVLNYLVVASYPAQVRATATGWAIGMGRFGAIIGSAIGGSILAQSGVNGYFFALAVPLALAWVCVLLIRKSSDSSAQALQQPVAQTAAKH
ncbi:MFS transporter [Vitreoscilla massiliensis]|uniref:MFS transporter n=1 Tax=Vitreoscilla massiliensis TaxID=1689272 RepID=A0ABY4E249_9NEIS|nr:MFS transporter [Vitreoscilla massiliensis]UOO89861.1 MFS transporter [Vitreoscilla massiliensis]